MLTPQEVSEHAFAKAGFGGYNMAMVDEFLDTVTADYTALYKENAALKAKMKVLVEKVEEYRSTEDAMRKTLLTAQNMADEMVREAERKKSEVMAAAEANARVRLSEIQKGLADEEARLLAAQNATALCIAKARELYQKELDNLDRLSTLTAPVPVSGVDPVAAAVAEIEASMSRVMEPEEVPAAASFEEDTVPFEPVAVPEAAEKEEQQDEDDEPSGRIDLSDLQFGKDFNLD